MNNSVEYLSLPNTINDQINKFKKRPIVRKAMSNAGTALTKGSQHLADLSQRVANTGATLTNTNLDSHQNMVESYSCSNCPTIGKNDRADQIQNVYTPCADCGSIYLAKKVRTSYDQYWMNFYDTKAQNTSYNLMNLQFAPIQ